MSYVLTAFDRLPLPAGAPTTPVGTAPTVGEIVQLPGGQFFDGRGQMATAKLPYTLSYKATATIPNGTLATLDTNLLTPLRQRRGRSADLERRLASGVFQWCQARLMQIQATRAAKDIAAQELTLVFEVLSLWHSTLKNESFHTLANPTTEITVTNPGTAAVRGVELRFSPAATAITELHVTSDKGMDWTYSGSIAGGKHLVVDGETWSVRNDGVGDWGHLAFGAGHEADGLIYLTAAYNTVLTVVRTGGSATDQLRLRWWDCWE